MESIEKTDKLLEEALIAANAWEDENTKWVDGDAKYKTPSSKYLTQMAILRTLLEIKEMLK